MNALDGEIIWHISRPLVWIAQLKEVPKYLEEEFSISQTINILKEAGYSVQKTLRKSMLDINLLEAPYPQEYCNPSKISFENIMVYPYKTNDTEKEIDTLYRKFESDPKKDKLNKSINSLIQLKPPFLGITDKDNLGILINALSNQAIFNKIIYKF